MSKKGCAWKFSEYTQAVPKFFEPNASSDF